MAAKLLKICYLTMLNIAFLCFFIRCSLSAPMEPVYTNFVRDLNSSKCSSPDQIKLPLNASTAESNDDNLLSHLKLCQNLETVEHHKEAQYLCQEIFDNLKVILCPPISAQVLAANITLSKDVCKDIESLKDVPEDKVMLKRLTDMFTCQLMCDGEYESTCQVLLWSHQLQQESQSIESPQKEEKKNSLQEGLKAVADDNIADDPNNANPEAQKKTTSDKSTSSAGSTKQQDSNEILKPIMKSTTAKQDQQNQVSEQGKPGSSIPNPPQIQPNETSLNNLPLHQNNLTGNNSLNAGNKVPEFQEMQNNELPDQDGEPPNVGFQEQEDPHDQHYELDTKVNQPQAPDNALPDMKVKNELSNKTKQGTLEQNESNPQGNLPKVPVDEEPIEPHDAEEAGEEAFEETEPKIPSETDKQKVEVAKASQGNGAVQSSTTDAKTTLEKTSAPQQQSTAGTTKKLIPPTNKETTLDEKTTTGKSQSTLDQKTSELSSSVQSQESSSLVPSVSTAALEEMEGDKGVHERPEDREPDPYSEIYEHKNKETLPGKPNEEEVPKMDVMSPREPSYNDFSHRNTYNRQPEVMPIFPDQEDGHFFFYFLSIVLILMGGYLLFHNKQKIIALIVEGRHERRRRSHGVGYKKLETK